MPSPAELSRVQQARKVLKPLKKRKAGDQAEDALLLTWFSNSTTIGSEALPNSLGDQKNKYKNNFSHSGPEY